MNCLPRALLSLEGLMEGLKDTDLNGNPWLKFHPEQKEVTDLPGKGIPRGLLIAQIYHWFW